MTHSEYIRDMNTGPMFFEQAVPEYNPDQWLKMFRDTPCGTLMTSYIRSLAHWMQVNGRWVRR